jgi:hypothetical protein
MHERHTGADAPTLVMLDPRRLRPLRGTEHAELKNDLMMALLSRMEWYRVYRFTLDEYRTNSGPQPTYPSKAVERVEALVDTLIVDALDTEYQR